MVDAGLVLLLILTIGILRSAITVQLHSVYLMHELASEKSHMKRSIGAVDINRWI